MFNAEQEIAIKVKEEQERKELLKSELKADALVFVSDHEPDIDKFIDYFGNKILELSEADQVIFHGIKSPRKVFNAPGIADIPESICEECPFSNVYGDIYSNGDTIIMDDCSNGYYGIMLHKDCPIKSSLVQRVYLGEDIIGQLSVHYINSKHHFTKDGIDIMQTVARYLGLLVGRIEAKRVEQEMIEAESANKAKTEFLFTMSHDIRTPMNAILGYTNIALRNLNDRERVTNSLNIIKTSSILLLGLVNEFLEMSRIEAGKLEIIDIPVNLYDSNDSLVDMCKALADSKGINFKADIAKIKNPYIYADEVHINQVMLNLVSNAVKYTPEGGHVEYYVEEIDDHNDEDVRLRITIKDDGIGMSEEFQEHLFENFSREETTTTSRVEGTGLGLSIVKKIIDQANGTITVYSKKGEGSTFIVEIPFRAMDKEAIKEYKDRLKKLVSKDDEFSFDNKKVLVVDDNELNREIVIDILEEAAIGLAVDYAEDGQKAIDKIKEKGIEYYDFVLMDIQMPVMDGCEAAKEIRKLENGDTLPIIALSANAFKEDVDKSIKAGMNAHLSKPINTTELFETLASISKN